MRRKALEVAGILLSGIAVAAVIAVWNGRHPASLDARGSDLAPASLPSAEATVAPKRAPHALLEGPRERLTPFVSSWRQAHSEPASSSPFPDWPKIPLVREVRKGRTIAVVTARLPVQVLVTTSNDGHDRAGRHTETIIVTPLPGTPGTFAAKVSGGRHLYLRRCGGGIEGYCFRVPPAWLKRYVYISSYWTPATPGKPLPTAVWVMRVEHGD